MLQAPPAPAPTSTQPPDNPDGTLVPVPVDPEAPSSPPANEDGECAMWDVQCLVRQTIEDATDDFMQSLIEGALNGTSELFRITATAWFDVPTPSSLAGVVSQIDNSLAWLAASLAIASSFFGVIRMMWTQRAAYGMAIMRMIFIYVASGTVLASAAFALIKFGDLFAPWIVQQLASETANGEQLAEFMTTVVLGFGPNGVTAVAGSFQAFAIVALIMIVLLCIATLGQTVFMLLRAPVMLVLIGLLPLFAADTVSDEGLHRFRRACAYLVAFAMYKPAAALIYGTSIALVKNSEDNALMSLLWGMITMLLAALALPGLIKLLVPPAAIGSSNATSGGSVLGATGAVVMGGAALGATVATGGAAAPAAAGAASSAGASGAASSAAGSASAGALGSGRLSIGSGSSGPPGVSGGGGGPSPISGGGGGPKELGPGPGAVLDDMNSTAGSSANSAISIPTVGTRRS